MLSAKLEERLVRAIQSGVAIDKNLVKELRNYVARLYFASTRNEDISPLREYVEVLRHLNFRQKLLVYENLRTTGDYWKQTKLSKRGTFYINAADYFWSNFIRIDKKKADPSIMEYIVFLQEQQSEKSA